MPHPIPEKLMTMCEATIDVDTPWWRYQSRHSVNHAGVLFYPPPQTHDAVVRILRDPTVVQLFQGTRWGILLADKLHVSNSFKGFPDPKGWTERTRIYMDTGTGIHTITVGQLFDSCLQLRKFLECRNCEEDCFIFNSPRVPWHTVPCNTVPQLSLPLIEYPVAHIEHLFRGGDVVKEEFNAEYVTTKGDLEAEEWVAWKTQVAGHTYVSPRLSQTAMDYLRPEAPFWVASNRHDFTQVEVAHSNFSDRSKAAGKTRNMLRTQCAHCCVEQRCGNKNWASACEHGAWTEEQVTDTTLMLVQPLLEKAKVSLDELWGIANICGVYFTVKRCLYTVACVALKDDNIQFRVTRVAKKARHTDRFFTYQQLLEWLPEEMLQLTTEAPPRYNHLLCMWLQFLYRSCDVSYNFYVRAASCVCSCEPAIGYVALNTHYNHLTIGVWGKTFDRTTTLRDYGEIADRYEDLLFHTQGKEPELYRSWYH